MKTEPKTPPAPADGDLIAQCLAGETTAFAILIDRHRQRLERLLRALLRDQWEREEVWQETLIRAYFNLEQLRDAHHFGAWLCAIAANLARSQRSAQRVRMISWEELTTETTLTSGQMAQQSPETLVVEQEANHLILAAINDLPAAERDAVLLVYLEGQNHKEAALHLGVSLSAVKVRVHRGRRRLQKILQAEIQPKYTQLQQERKMIQVEVVDVMRATERIAPPVMTEQVVASSVSGTQPMVEQNDPASWRMILLKEVAADRVLPIWVGMGEGEMLAMFLRQQAAKRPMTYELMSTLLELGKVKVERVVIARLHEATFFSNLTVTSGDGSSEIDCRPSDAINLAVRLGLPIYVATEVMAQTAKAPNEPWPSEYRWESVLGSTK